MDRMTRKQQINLATLYAHAKQEFLHDYVNRSAYHAFTTRSAVVLQLFIDDAFSITETLWYLDEIEENCEDGTTGNFDQWKDKFEKAHRLK